MKQNEEKECKYCYTVKPISDFYYRIWGDRSPKSYYAKCEACYKSAIRLDWNDKRRRNQRPYRATYEYLWADIPNYAERVRYSESVLQSWRSNILNEWKLMLDDESPYYYGSPLDNFMDDLARLAIHRFYAARHVDTLSEELEFWRKRSEALEKELDYTEDHLHDVLGDLYKYQENTNE